MADVATSINGIASFGTKLTRTLYEFESTASAAKEQTDFIARHVSLYATVLDLLCDRINDETPLLSNKAYYLVEELGDQSYQLFYKIRDLLPSRDRDELTFFEKVKWNFKKSKVEFLVGELDYLRSTVHLLVTVLFAGKKIRSYNKGKKGRSVEKQQRDRDDLSNHCLKAQNAVLEHINAADKLPILEAEAHRSERSRLDHRVIREEEAAAAAAAENKAVELVSRQNEVIAKFQHSLIAVRNSSDRQALVLNNSAKLLHDLLSEWTIVYHNPDERNQNVQNEETDKRRNDSSTRVQRESSYVRDQSPVTNNRPRRTSGGAPFRPEEEQSSESHSSEPGSNENLRPRRTKSSTSRNTGLPNADFLHEAGDRMPDREANEYANYHEQKRRSHVSQKSLESLRGPRLGASRERPKPTKNSVFPFPPSDPESLRDQSIGTKGDKMNLADEYEPPTRLHIPMPPDRSTRASKRPPKPTVEDATSSDEAGDMPSSGRYKEYVRGSNNTNIAQARVEREIRRRKPNFKESPMQSRYSENGLALSVTSSNETRYYLDTGDETRTIVDPSEFGGPDDYRAAYIRADKKGKRGWETPVVNHAENRRIQEEYRKEKSRPDFQANPMRYSDGARFDTDERDWAEPRDDLATVDASDDRYRERFVENARRDGSKAYLEPDVLESLKKPMDD